MWDSVDQANFNLHVARGIGQICNDPFSDAIRLHSRNPENKTFLEIGTWNGLGSTKQFVDELVRRTDEYVFYSLECQIEKSNYAAELYKKYDRIHILNEVLFNTTPDGFYETFPQCKSSALFKRWNDVDISNMSRCSIFTDRPDLPDIFDVVLLDGGEFTTYFEFLLLRDRCKILMLDDIVADKCKLIVSEIESNPAEWTILEKNTSVRNGFMVCRRIGL
jgi:hypothetical protein